MAYFFKREKGFISKAIVAISMYAASTSMFIMNSFILHSFSNKMREKDESFDCPFNYFVYLCN